MDIILRDGGFVLASWKNVFLNHWGEEVSLERLQKLWDAEKALVAKVGKVGVLTIIGRAGKMLTLPAPQRAMAGRIAKDMESSMLAQAHAVLGSGFMTATVRSVIASVQIIEKRSHPVKVFDDLQGASAWMAPLVGHAAHSAELLTAAQQVLGTKTPG